VNQLREAEMKKHLYEEFHFQISVIIRQRTVERSRFADKTSAAR